MHEGTAKSKLQKIVNTKEGLRALRIDIMKHEAEGKSIALRSYQEKFKLPSAIVQYMTKAGAVEDYKPDASTKEGKYLKWIYKGNEDGTVDEQLVQRVIDEERKYQKEWRDSRRGLEELAPKVIAKHTPDKNGGMEAIVTWLTEKLEKEEQVSGFLRPDEKYTYTRLIEMLNGLQELRTVMQKINL